jgi:uncharacterized membrane protein YkvI
MCRMENNKLSAVRIAAVYIGTVVGAGFATGQEIMQFFVVFGPFGILGLLLVTVLFYLFGSAVMSLGKRLDAHSHAEVISPVGGGGLGPLIDVIITFSLFCTVTTMVAGTGALCAQEFGFRAVWGNLMMAALTAATVLTGFRGVVNAISLIVPFLLAAVILTGALSIAIAPPSIGKTAGLAHSNGLISGWLPAALLYVSYNMILAVPVLSPLGREAKGTGAIKTGGLLGGLGLGIGALMIHLVISGRCPDITAYDVPMVHIAGGLSAPLRVVYTLVLAAEIYSTAVGALFGFAARFAEKKSAPRRFGCIVIAATAGSLLFSQWGFVNMVKVLFPIEGYAGLLLLICLVLRFRELRKT